MHSSNRFRRAVFPALVGLFALIYLWRISGVAPVERVSSHLSNFYLSGAALTLLIGWKGFVDPSARVRSLILAASFAVLNVVVEILLVVGNIDEAINSALGGVNTTDPIDGLAGIAGVLLVVLLLPATEPADAESIEPPSERPEVEGPPR